MAAHGNQCFAGGEEWAVEVIELEACTVKGKRVQMMSLCPPGQVKQKKRDRRVSVGTESAVTTWRPAGGLGRRGARARTQQRREAGLGRGGDDAWMLAQQEVDGGGLISGGQGSGTDGGAEKIGEKQSRAGARGRRREGRGSRDLFAKLKNYRDSSVI
jgi:hypothetical protein